MDPNLMRHIEYFSVPNNQTGKSIDRAGASRPAAPQPLSPWNTSSLDPANQQHSTASFEAYQQAQNQAVGGISFDPPERQRPLYSQGPRQILPTRTSNPARDRHDRKRSKLSTDATPFDSVDYWLQFDNNEEGIPEESAADSAAKAETQANSAKQGAADADRQRKSRPSASRQVSQSNLGATDEGVDDSALDNALSDDEDENFSNINLAEHLSKIDSVAPSEVPQREGLYSTPLSWERPQPGLRMDSIMSIQSPATLDQAEQRRLIAIAMNPGPSSGGLGSSIAGHYQYDLGLGPAMGSSMSAAMSQIVNISGTHPQAARPGAMYPPYHPPREGSMNDKGKDKAVKPGDRTAHNDIERKYRTNLKDKIAELRDAVPALRTIPENDVDDGDEGGQPSRGPKVSKGAVLTKATEYIHYLEKKNKAIVQQHQELSRRLQAFEQLLSATARPTYQMPNYSRTLFDPRAFC
ncbi:hypothetical protein GGTG_00126 [Gaeumannomyces tritici R3-111a-1]|uniref:BHLH domain-containing protein n=1 Tax=Gaeumannomyces tritici (strain R3-111a-1) TaxID=644352 RepID=J3NFT2_GAET3|nr:hypothetical protein GGTG_00126 [Gaeumannomyces tritici R3-111a-1]EJT80122.1 hypothetical protein GGTG_00126 [Gaeumannomyces tritici R3-111a-1]